MLLTIVSFVVVLGILVFVHEFGHYITAKLSDIRVEEFALGFGPKLVSRQWGETAYSIRIIPLGGFCNLTGEFPPDDDVSEEELEIYNEALENGRCFHQKSIGKRFAVLFMGPLMNFLLAIVVFSLVFFAYGIPVDSSPSTVIGQVEPNKPAARAGLQPGDQITAINNQEVEEWSDMASLIHNSNEKIIKVEYKRGDNKFVANIKPEYNEEVGADVIGIYPRMIKEKIGLFKSIQLGFVQTWNVVALTVTGFAQMISQRSAEELGGPIMIASIVGQAAKIGLSNLLNWLAIISINLGIINLLPFPALDGGRILFILVELVRGKPVPAEKEGFVHFIGFILLMVLMVFIIYRDLVRALF